MKNDPCEYCDGTVDEVVTQVPFHYRREIIYVDNVPVDRCDKCGELYFPAKVYKELERVVSSRKQISGKIGFPLADYRKTAARESRKATHCSSEKRDIQAAGVLGECKDHHKETDRITVRRKTDGSH